MLSRRLFLQGSGATLFAGSGLGAYACGIEPGLRLDVTSYSLTPPRWPKDLRLKCAVIADLHACEPWVGVDRIRQIVAVTNAMKPDITVLLGDFNGGHEYVTGPVYAPQWGEVLADLRAPLGIYAILGNHDWWHGALPHMRSDNAESVRRALRHANIFCLENQAVGLTHGTQTFWVAGLGDQMAMRSRSRRHHGLDDLDGTLAQVTDDAPILLLAHEPHIFDEVPERVSLTLCGHTHGGQINLPVFTDWWAHHRMGDPRHVYGHIIEDGRHLIISGGIGTSVMPIRMLRPPEIVMVTLGGGMPTSQIELTSGLTF